MVRNCLILIPFIFVLVGCGGGSAAPLSTNTNDMTNADDQSGANDNVGSDQESSSDSSSAPKYEKITKEEASRFLNQATFGPNMEEIDYLLIGGIEKWIDEQMKIPATSLYDILNSKEKLDWNEHINTWWYVTINSKDQLRQRVAFALSQILVVSDQETLSGQQLGLMKYYDILVNNAFGNFRDLIEEVTLSPVMGEYLSMQGNRKPNLEKNIRPDENFARELMQLFTIGLVKLNPDGTIQKDSNNNSIPTYTQEQVEAFAHVFTGWNFANAEKFDYPKENYIEKMQAYEDYHDVESHELLNGEILPAGLSASQSLEFALDNIFSHSNVGPFICKQLIQRLVISNPSPEYVKRVASVFEKDSSGRRGDLGSVVKAILLDDEARVGHLVNTITYGKLKEPLIRLTNLWRAFHAAAKNGEYQFAWVFSDIGQGPLESPSVFNFYSPDFSQPGSISSKSLVSPEFQIHDESSIVALTNRLYASIYWRVKNDGEPSDSSILIDLEKEKELAVDPDALLDRLNLLLMAGNMSEKLRENVKEMIMFHKDTRLKNRVTEAIFLILSSPESAILR